ncbi:MAG: amidohydrolase [Betaproteobacteria bacterium]|nr:amidohydrolase [Betaproteobacteria bacterium]NBU49878.1 amidohydrolase [Betaproteobacteria bacterium]
MTTVLEELRPKAEAFTALRREIHRFPELAFDEHRTSEMVARKLRDWGYDVTRGLGGTGVVGTMRRGLSGRALGIRADMDALPIAEETGRPWSSTRPGLMHACGHDGHTAMLLGAAQHLAETGGFDGTVHLIFQPAEEGGGGALKMMEDGLFDRFPCDAIFAMHNMPGVPQGHLWLREGPMMASSDYATITVRGHGGHGAMPHQASDPLVAAASLVMALQTVVSRNVDPQQTAVVTIGAFHAGQANNVIPASAKLELSVRALDPAVRELLRQRIHALAAAQAESFGVKADIDWRSGYAVLINAAEPTEFARGVARELVGAERVNPQAPALTGSEDFSFMLQQVPGSYLLIGNGDGPGSCMVHNPAYDFNDDIIATGSAFWVLLTRRFLAA